MGQVGGGQRAEDPPPPRGAARAAPHTVVPGGAARGVMSASRPSRCRRPSLAPHDFCPWAARLEVILFILFSGIL